MKTHIINHFEGDTKTLTTPSNQTFGFFFAALFLGFALYQHYQGNFFLKGISGYLLGVLFLLITLLFPAWLSPFNRAWTRLGLFLHKIVNPLVMALLFFGIITPIGILGRIFKRDALSLKSNPKAKSYWRLKNQDGVSSMKNQF